MTYDYGYDGYCKTQLIASFLGVLTESGERIREPYDQPVRPSAADSEPSCTKKSSQMPPVVYMHWKIVNHG